MSDLVPVCVFAKPPIEGQVKTRLAPVLGARQATALARAFFEDTWAMVCAVPWARPVLATTSEDLSPFGLDADEVEVWLQGDGELGARLERVLHRALAGSPSALIIGADLPGLPASHLASARAALTRADVVLGPASDGGFYLLGATRPITGALEGVGWSAPTTFAQTRAALHRSGCSVGEAPGWFDVDVPDDLPALKALLAARPGVAPQTRAILRSLA
jgi:hypothetical protein